MSKRFYIVTFILLSLTIVLFSVSYSKDSGMVQYNDYQNKVEGINTIYEKGNNMSVYKVAKLDDYENLETNNIRVTNTSNDEISYALQIECDDCLNKLYYSVEEGKKEIIKSYVTYLGKLNKFGEDGDSLMLKLRLFSSEDYKKEVKINIISIDVNTLSYKILNSNGTYYKNGSYYYYANNNYIKYNNEIYRIICSNNGTTKIVRFGIEEKYNPDNKYISKEDIFNTFKEEDINDDNMNGYDSWIKEENNFWVSDNKYYSNSSFVEGNEDTVVRSSEVVQIKSSLLVSSGNGSMESPYEVTYEG